MRLAGEERVGLTGPDVFDMLQTRLNAEYQTACKTIYRLLTNSSIQKVAHGKRLMRTPVPGIWLDMEIKEKNKEYSTSADLLRHTKREGKLMI